MRLIAAGVSFRTAPLEVRERAALADPEARQLLRFLVGHGGLSGAAAISTCNRTELYVSLDEGVDDEEAVSRLRRYLDPLGAAASPDSVTVHRAEEAAQHLFRVASGLDSMVIGEAQVLGQVKAAHRLALEAGSLDALLDFVFRRAISAGKRVRTLTGISRGAGSIGEAAVALAEQVLGNLQDRSVLLIGAGKMSALAARRLHRQGARLRITSRGGESAAALADELGAAAIPTEDVAAAMVDCDLVITSTSSPTPVVDREQCAAVQERRGGRPLCLVDVAVPRDIDPEVAGLPGVTLVDIDTLGRHLDGSLRDRQQAVAEAEAMVAEAARQALAVVGQRDASDPTIRALLARAETIRRDEVRRTLARLPESSPEVAERIDRLTRSLVRKLLHGPVSHLRAAVDDPAVVLMLREAFGLDDHSPGER